MTVNFSNNPYKDLLKMAGTQQPVSSPVKGPVQKDKVELASVKVGDVESQENDSKTSKKKIFGIIGVSVGSVALLTLIGLSLLSKGFSSTLSKKLQQYSDKIKNSIYELTAESKKLTPSQKMKLYLVKGLQPMTDSLQAASNVTAMKDALFHKFMKKMNIGHWVDKINKPFKKIVLTTKNKAYSEAELSMIEFCNGLKKTKNPKLEQYADVIKKQYLDKFSSDAHISRADSIWAKTKNLHDEVYGTLFETGEGGFFKNLKKFRSYVTTDKIAKDKNLIQKELEMAKLQISNGIPDIHGSMKQALFGVKNEVNPQNKDAVELVKKLSESLDKYKTLGKTLSGDAEKIARDELTANIKNNLTALLAVSRKDVQKTEKLVAVEKEIHKMFDVISEKASKRGAAQDAIAEIKAQFGKNSPEYKIATQQLQKMNKKLNTALTSEMNAYEKLAELQVGSAPTDILGILGPSALATLMVVNSKDKDERVSKTLTKGIPILGGIGMSYYGTTRGFTGAKNLVLGLATGAILNLIGSKTDEKYKKYSEKQGLLKMAYASFNKLQAKHTAEVNVSKIEAAGVSKSSEIKK